jgi:hypothetical protein
VKEKYLEILLNFVPAKCTSVLQPADVILHRPFKHAFRQQYDMYTSASIDTEFKTKVAKDVRVDTKMSTLKPLLCSWLLLSWQHINKPLMIKVGWSQCGLLQAFQQPFQVHAMDENMKTPLFLNEPAALEDEYIEKEDEVDTDMSIEVVMQNSLDLLQQLSISKKLPNSSKTLLGRKRYGPVYEIDKLVSFCLYFLLFLLFLSLITIPNIACKNKLNVKCFLTLMSSSKKLPNSSKTLLRRKSYGPVHETDKFVSLIFFFFDS